MKRRMCSVNGLGSGSTSLLSNNGNLNKVFCSEALEEFFKKHEYFDFQINSDGVLIGIEPTYQYDELFIICIHSDKNKSYIQHGKAWGPYGSDVAKRIKFYSDYKNECKFTKFIDKWSECCSTCGSLIISHGAKCFL